MSLTYWKWIFIISVIPHSTGDVYMHNPRGSNNRLDEEGRERNNGNRLFDSQNNDRGGYNVGSLYYYQGSILPIEWTNQHSCGGPNNNCELIVQYMCDGNVRDGATTTTIPDNPAQCDNYDCNSDLRYGMNENYDYYLSCVTRERNKGLFTADQNLNGQTAQYTRQNPAGTRRGYECPEERDYYPYWHPTPWRDIAVMTNSASRCKYYKSESENVKGRYACVVPYMLMMQNAKNKNFVVPNDEADCKAWKWPPNSANGTTAEWKFFPSHGIPAPVCQETEFSRDNHLGNGLSGHPNLYNWTIPSSASGANCVIRLRYNISTADYEGWDNAINASQNQVKANEGTLVDLSQKYGLSNYSLAKARGYVLKNNPQVNIFNSDKFKLQLAVNTAQYGRTFQDRSHAMTIKEAPAELRGQRIFNLNVRGKRGNIVQVYPAVEYDFVPNTLIISANDYIHIQWTGSNSNPGNNDGQGQAGSDRSNLVVLSESVYHEGMSPNLPGDSIYGHLGRNFPAKITDGSLLGLSKQDLISLAILSPGQFRGALSELDDAGTYFDLGVRKITQAGVLNYMSTRNNNFSNRDQKGKIVVRANGVRSAQIGSLGGSVALPNDKAVLTADESALPALTYVVLEEWPSTVGHQKIVDSGKSMDLGSAYASDFVIIKPEGRITAENKQITVSMKLNQNPGSDIKIYRTNSENFASWQQIEHTLEGNVAQFQVSEGGVYVARSGGNVGLIVGLVVGALVIMLLVIGTVYYFRKNPQKYDAITRRIRNAQRSAKGDF